MNFYLFYPPCVVKDNFQFSIQSAHQLQVSGATGFLSPPMHSSPKIANMFCSISKGKDVMFSYNGGDLNLEKLASVWQEKAPAHHAWYSHTDEKRTFGFLMKDGYVYFVINDRKGNLENLQFLKNLRYCFLTLCKKDDFQSELSAAIRRMTSPEGMYPHLAPADHTPKGSLDKYNCCLMRTSSQGAAAWAQS